MRGILRSSRTSCDGPAGLGRVADVVQLQRLALGPGEPRQAAELVADLLAGRVQLLEPVAGAVPGGAADEHAPGRQPHLAHGAAGEVADGLDGGGQDPVAGVGLALHGGVGQFLVGRVGQRRQAAAAQPPGRAHPEQVSSRAWLATMTRPLRSSTHADAVASSTSASDRSTLDVRISHYRGTL
jgi:hypothetical protein